MEFKQSVFVIVVALACVFLQATIFGTFLPRWFIPNLCLTIIIFLGIHQSNPLGSFLAFMVGIFLDLASTPLIGPWAGALVAIFCLIAQGGRKLFVDNSFALIVVSFFCSIVSQIIYLFLLAQFSLDLSDIFSWTFLGNAVSSSILAPFVYLLLIKYYPRKDQRKQYIQQRLF